VRDANIRRSARNTRNGGRSMKTITFDFSTISAIKLGKIRKVT